MEIIAINRSEACAVLSTGHVIHFSVMLDRDGDETESVDDAMVAVAPLPDGRWVVIDFSEFETVSVH